MRSGSAAVTAAGIGGLVVSVAVGGAPAAQDDAAEVTLAVTGRAGVQVKGICFVRGPEGGAAEEAIAGGVPLERRWRAVGLRCELWLDGPAMVEIARGGGGSRSRTSTSGGRAVVEVG